MGSLRRPRLRRPRNRAVVAAVIAAVGLFAAFWFWFRDSSFTSVEQVRIAGVSGPEAGAIESSLRRSARGMSTLDFSASSLQAAVASFPQVKTVEASTSFPHSMHITVVEQLPAAVLVGPTGVRSAVAGDGAVLGSKLASSSLPTLSVNALPRHKVKDAQTRSYLAILGAAPASLVGLLARAYSAEKGTTVELRNGMLVYFGDAARPQAKWLAFARALLANGTTEVAYVDVRAPERPAVGASTASTAASSATGGGASTGAATQGGTEASLIAGLQAIVTGGGGLTPQTTTTPPGQSPSEPSGEAGSEAAGSATEPGSSGSGATAGGSGEAPAESAGTASGEAAARPHN